MPAHSSTFNSNKTWRVQLFVLAVFVLLLSVVSHWLGVWYEQAAAQNKINAWSKQRFDEFYATPPHTLDMVFIGSSHAYCTFDPENIDAALGTNSYQLGMPLQLPDASYTTLLELLKTQRPQTVVMEIYWDVLNKDFELKQVDGLFKVLKDEDTKTDFIKTVFPLNEKVKYAIKPIRYQQDFLTFQNSSLLNALSDNYKLKRTIKQNVGEEYYRSKGYIYCDYVMDDEAYDKVLTKSNFDGQDWRISAVQKKYLEKIVALCRDNNMDLIFVTAPVSNVYFEKMEHYDQIHNQIAALGQAFDVPYLDFNLVNAEQPLFSDQHFRDWGHLNDNGVKVANDYFATWLQSNHDPITNQSQTK